MTDVDRPPKTLSGIVAELRARTVDDAAALLREVSPDDLIAALVELTDDPELLGRLASRRDVTFALSETFRLTADPATAVHPARQVATVAARCIVNNHDSVITFRHSYIAAGLARRVVSDQRHVYYKELVDELTAPQRFARSGQRGGLYYILIDAAKWTFRSRDHARALQLNATARSLRDELPESTRSAQARFQGAVQFASVAAYMDAEHLAALMPEVLDDLHAELARVVQHAGAEARVFQLRAVLAETNLWSAAGAVGVCGRITSAEKRIDLLRQAMAQLYGATINADGEPDRRRLDQLTPGLPPEVASSLGRVVVELAQAYVQLDWYGRAAVWIEYARTYTLSSRSLLDLDLLMARFVDESNIAITQCEQFLRDQLTGAVNSARWDQRARALRRYAAVATNLSNTLKSNGQPASARFWKMQARFWRKECEDVSSAKKSPYFVLPPAADGQVRTETIDNYLRYVQTETELDTADTHQDGQPTRSEIQRARQRVRSRRRRKARAPQDNADITIFDDVAVEPSSADDRTPRLAEQNAADVEIGDLVRHNLVKRFTGFQELVAHENVGEMITCLSNLTQSYRIKFDDELTFLVGQAMAALAEWRPALFTATSEQLAAGHAHDQDEVVTAALAAAAVLADSYAPRRLVPVLVRLSQRPDLDVDDRLSYVRRARAVARSQNRLVQEVRCLYSEFLLGTLADAPHDVDMLVDSLKEILVYAQQIAASIGVSDLADRAVHLSRELNRLAVLLREMDPGATFEIASLTEGWIGDALAKEPQLLGEFEVALQAQYRDDSDDSLRYHESILTRICTTRTAPLKQTDRERPRSATRPGEATVRFVQSGGEVLVLAERVRAPGTRPDYVVRTIGRSARELAELAQGIYFALRSDQRLGELDLLVRRLHDEAVAPWWDDVRGAAGMTIAFQDGLPFLPLHGALGPEGHLGTRIPISYAFSNTRPPARTRTSPPVMGVFGWDAQTMSDVEARDVRATLGHMFSSVGASTPASACDDVILKSSCELDILHVAGHGHFREFPLSMESTVEVSEGVAFSAAQFLTAGCTADFVFFNVCGIGMNQTVSGDIYGFPLAARVRGARAMLAPTTFVSPEHAREFAAYFYDEVMVRDAASACQSVINRLVTSGAPLAVWLPYALHGNVPALAAWSDQQVGDLVCGGDQVLRHLGADGR